MLRGADALYVRAIRKVKGVGLKVRRKKIVSFVFDIHKVVRMAIYFFGKKVVSLLHSTGTTVML